MYRLGIACFRTRFHFSLSCVSRCKQEKLVGFVPSRRHYAHQGLLLLSDLLLFLIYLSAGAAVELALALVARHVGAGVGNSDRCAMGVLGAGARAVDRNSPRLFLQGGSFGL